MNFTNNGNYRKLRLGMQCVANIITFVALIITLDSMFTSGWQIAFSADGYGLYEHGLYRDCVRGQDNIRPTNDWVCFWKFDQNNHIQTDRFFRLREYQESVLVILGVACALAVVSMICACVTCCVRLCNLPWAVALFLTALTSLIGIIVFYRNSSISDNRFVRMYMYEVDMWYGWSFYLCITGFILWALALLMAGGCVALSFMEMRKDGGGSSNGAGGMFKGRNAAAAAAAQRYAISGNVAGSGAGAKNNAGNLFAGKSTNINEKYGGGGIGQPSGVVMGNQPLVGRGDQYGGTGGQIIGTQVGSGGAYGQQQQQQGRGSPTGAGVLFGTNANNETLIVTKTNNGHLIGTKVNNVQVIGGPSSTPSPVQVPVLYGTQSGGGSQLNDSQSSGQYGVTSTTKTERLFIATNTNGYQVDNVINGYVVGNDMAHGYVIAGRQTKV